MGKVKRKKGKSKDFLGRTPFRFVWCVVQRACPRVSTSKMEEECLCVVEHRTVQCSSRMQTMFGCGFLGGHRGASE